MSIFDMLFSKKPSPYELDPSHPDYDYYAGLRASDETAQRMLDVTNATGNMSPLIASEQQKAAPASKAKVDVPKKFSEPPLDAEDAAYSSWAEANGKDVPGVNVPHVGKPNIPVRPNIPAKPNVTPLTPVKGGMPKRGDLGSDLGSNGRTYGDDFGVKPFFQPFQPKIPERDVFAFVVENSNDTFKQKEKIINIISQTVEKKKDAIFLFVRAGNEQTAFSPMDYNSVKVKNIISSLITTSNDNKAPNLASALFYIVNNLNIFSADTFSFGKTKYKLGNCSIVCIGTGACIQTEDSSQITSSCISKLQNMSKLKAFKYFCIKDSDAIRVSAMGFPVIGHIISDFYEEGD